MIVEDVGGAALAEGQSDTPDPDQAWKALSLVNEWIRHSEAKTGATLAAAGVSGGLLYNLVKSLGQPPLLIDVLAVICGLSALAAGWCSAMALIPRLTVNPRKWWSRRQDQPSDDWSNLLFYSHIAREYGSDEPSYQEVLRALTLDKTQLTRHLANQIHANSVVAQRKFEWVTRALRLLIVTLLSLAIIAAIIGGKFCGVQ